MEHPNLRWKNILNRVVRQHPADQKIVHHIPLCGLRILHVVGDISYTECEGILYEVPLDSQNLVPPFHLVSGLVPSEPLAYDSILTAVSCLSVVCSLALTWQRSSSKLESSLCKSQFENFKMTFYSSHGGEILCGGSDIKFLLHN